MAGYRQFHTKFWKDEWTIDLDPLERYLFIYLFSNDLSSISGIYRVPLRVISNETGLEIDFVQKCLNKFEKQQKILYRDNTVWVVNMEKYHSNASPLTQTRVNKDIDTIPDNVVKQAYLCHKTTGIFCTDIVSIQYAYQSLKAKAIKPKTKPESEDEEETSEMPEFPPPSSSPPTDYIIRVWSKVTNMVTIPAGQSDKVLPALEALYYKHNRDEPALIEYLKPYYAAWTSRRTKDNRQYSKSNCTWLYDWAVAGEIPASGNGKSGNYDDEFLKLVNGGK